MTSTVDTSVVKIESCPKYVSDIIKKFPSMTMEQLAVITDYNQYFRNRKLPQKKSNLFLRIGWESMKVKNVQIGELIDNICFDKTQALDNAKCDIETICGVYDIIEKFIYDKKLNNMEGTIKCHAIKGISQNLGAYEELFPDELFNSWEDVND